MAKAAASRDAIAIRETDRLIASSRVEGTAVYNKAGERLGSVLNFMVDKFTGQVAYAVMSFGGFLGIGERFHPLPWKVLDYDIERAGYVVGLTREQLERAPHYALEDMPWADPKYGRAVYDYYNVPGIFEAQ